VLPLFILEEPRDTFMVRLFCDRCGDDDDDDDDVCCACCMLSDNMTLRGSRCVDRILRCDAVGRNE